MKKICSHLSEHNSFFGYEHPLQILFLIPPLNLNLVFRSHSHRLSPSASQMQHLSPHRSHSFRHPGTSNASNTSKPPSPDLMEPNVESKATKDDVKTGQNVLDQKNTYCSDDEADEPVFDDTSDDVSAIFFPLVWSFIL